MTPTVILLRHETGQDGSFGTLYTLGYSCKTLEPPWKENRRNVSCIPKGKYSCSWYVSQKFGGVYLIHDVSGRTGILTHSGNYGGDIEKGLVSHTLGCILLGKYATFFGQVGQKGVALSKPTCRRFFDHMKKEPFNLEIVDLF